MTSLHLADPETHPASRPVRDASRRAGPCAAWSQHAAELAVPLLAHTLPWPETPSTAGLVADGHLQRILPGVCVPPDLLATGVRRALALGCAIGERLRPDHLIAGASAAWVLVGGDPPAPAELITGGRRDAVPGAVVRDLRIGADEIEVLGGAPLSTPVRTAVDLLRFPGSDAETWLPRLVDAAHVEPDAVAAGLREIRHFPGIRAARGRLARIIPP